MFVSKKRFACLFLVVFAAGGCGGDTSEKLPTANLQTAPSGDPASGHAAGDYATNNEPSTSNELANVPSIQSEFRAEPVAPPAERFPEVTIVTSLGDIRVRLNAEKASETVDNFLYSYVERGFYDGTVFHFVQDGFIALAGGYDAELKAKEARPPIRNEAGNGLKNLRGTIAMSRHPAYADSATSQFYFNLVDNPSLDQTDPEKGETFGYCVFGEVVEGFDVVQKIAKVEVHDSGEFTKVPVTPIVIQSVQRDK